MGINRTIKYLNKDFDDFRSQLINFSKTYFPTTYTDFSPSSPGMMFMEMASYVGDVLSFYFDNQIQEVFLQHAKQTNNLYELAYMMHYKPKVTGLSNVDLDFFQLVPSKPKGSQVIPDFDYSLFIQANTIISPISNSGVNFIIEDSIDFSISNSLDPTEVSIAQIAGGQPQYYLLKKTRKSNSGNINTINFTFGNYQEFPTVEINVSNIAEILDIVDSDGNIWYEVDYLAQELIYDSLKNTNINDPNNYINSNDSPYILKTKKIQRRFVTRFLSEDTLQIQFGAGNSINNDEEIIPNPNNVGLGLPFEKNKLTTAYSPTNFLFTNTYGIAPSNITLTVRYITGGGVESNVPSNSLTSLNTSNTFFINSNLTDSTSQYVFNSLAVNNELAASGGKGGDNIEEIRQNSLSSFSAQLRNVTADDYLIRSLSMPSKFGVISKAHIQKPLIKDEGNTLDLYVLTYDINKNLTTASTTLKQNLKTYLNQYKMVGDSINIRDGFIINISCNFEIITLPNFNNKEVLNSCILVLQNYFIIDKWQINQPIIIRDITVLLDNINGVQTVKQVKIKNKTGTTLNYSKYAYDIESATQNDVVYPSLDPSIFEIKFLNQDIKGKVVSI